MWTTSPESIIGVTNGTVTTSNVGETTLTSSYVLNETKTLTASVKIKVTDTLNLVVTEGYEDKCRVGQEVPMDLKLSFDEGKTLIDLSDKQKEKVTWSSSDDSLAEVSSDGKVTFKATGQVTITVSYQCDDTTSIEKTIQINIEEMILETVTLSVKNSKELYEISDVCELEIYVNDSTTPISSAEFADATFVIKDSSDNTTDKATISGNQISFAEIGEFRITSTYKGKESNTVIFKVDGLEGISFEKDTYTIDTETADFALKVYKNFLFADDQEITDLSTLSWSGFDTNVITVTNGTVHVVGIGNTTVQASTTDGKNDTCSIKVDEHVDKALILFDEVVSSDDGYNINSISLKATDGDIDNEVQTKQIKFKSAEPSNLITSQLVNNTYHKISRLSYEEFTVKVTYVFDKTKQWGTDSKYQNAEGTIELSFSKIDIPSVTPGSSYTTITRVDQGDWEGHKQYRVKFKNGNSELNDPIVVSIPYYGSVSSITVNDNRGRAYLLTSTNSAVITFDYYSYPVSAGQEQEVLLFVEGSGDDFGLGTRPVSSMAPVGNNTSVAPMMMFSMKPALFSTTPSYEASSVNASDGSKAEYIIDTNNATYYFDQKDALLPYILKIDGDNKTRLDPSKYRWSSSDNSVVSFDYGKLSIKNTGNAKLTAEIDGKELSVDVTVVDNPELSGFYTKGDKYKVNDNEYVTQKWPTAKPSGLTRDTIYVEGNRIVDESGTYYYITQGFEASWNELVGNIGRYASEKDENGQYYVVRLPKSLFLTSDDFDENGNPINELHIGDVYVDGDSVYVLVQEDEKRSPVEPTGNSDCWEKLKDYDPGADTGPTSDALSYPDSMYNPYPGSLNTNCTWAVWYLANVNTGARLPNWGDAGNWYRRAGISGYSTGTKPAKNSILVMDHHVAYVTDVSEDGSQIYVKEGNIQGKYSEGWWTIDSSRLGMEVYGYIYLINDEGETVEAIFVTLEAGRHDSLDEFKAYLEGLGLELGEGEEVYDDEVPAGHIVSYRSGEVEKGSLINYKISLGPNPVKVIEIDETYVGKTAEEFVAYLRENGLKPGEVTTVDGEEDGIVAAIKTGSYSESDAVDFSVTRKKTEDNVETSSQENDVVNESATEILKNTKGMAEDKFLEYLKEYGLKSAEAELVETEDQTLISTIDQAKLGEDGKVHYVVYVLKTVDDNIEEIVADPEQIHKDNEGQSTNNEPVDSDKEQSTADKPDSQENGNEASDQKEEVSEEKTDDAAGEQGQNAEETSQEEQQPAESAEDLPGV